jgi:hypothetical protein
MKKHLPKHKHCLLWKLKIVELLSTGRLLSSNDRVTTGFHFQQVDLQSIRSNLDKQLTLKLSRIANKPAYIMLRMDCIYGLIVIPTAVSSSTLDWTDA